MTPTAQKNWKTGIWFLLGFCYGWIIRDEQRNRITTAKARSLVDTFPPDADEN